MLRAFGLSEIVFVLLVVLALAFVLERRRLKIRGPVLVLREFRVRAAGMDGDLITIRGRPAGIFAYLLSMFHLDDATSLVVTELDVRVETASLQGVCSEYVPMIAVASVECIYFRSFFVLIAAFGLFVLAGLFFFYAFLSTSNSDYARQMALDELRGFLWAGLVIGLILYIIYALSKRILIAVETSGGKSVGVAFKRSVIENISIELHQAQEAVALLNSKLLAKHEGQRPVATEES